MSRRAAIDPGWFAVLIAAVALVMAIRADTKAGKAIQKAGEVVESDKRLTRAIDNLGKVIKGYDR